MLLYDLILSEAVHWTPVTSTAMQSYGTDDVDRLLPQGTRTSDEEGNMYTWLGLNWRQDSNSRMASRDKRQELLGKEREKNPKGDIYVKFANGAEYIYQRVPRDVFDGFADASSKGQYFNRMIKDKYAFLRL